MSDYVIEYKLADGTLRKVVVHDAASVVEALDKVLREYPDVDVVLSIMPSVGL